MKTEQLISFLEENIGKKCIVKLNSGDEFNNVEIGRLNFSTTKKSVLGIALTDANGKGIIMEIPRIKSVDLI